jgi:hypothetical protein
MFDAMHMSQNGRNDQDSKGNSLLSEYFNMLLYIDKHVTGHAMFHTMHGWKNQHKFL